MRERWDERLQGPAEVCWDLGFALHFQRYPLSGFGQPNLGDGSQWVRECRRLD